MKKLLRWVMKEASKRDGATKNLDGELLDDKVSQIKELLKSGPFFIRKMLGDAAKKLPHHPGGRRRATTVEEQLEIVEEITSLSRKGTELRTAKERVAQKRGISLSTVQRIWKHRAQLGPQ